MQAIRGALRALSFALLALLVATPLAQIVMRSVFNVPMSGAEELTRYFLVCAVFVAAPLVTREGGQIAMEEMQALVPAWPRWWLQMAIELAGIAFFALMAVAAVVTIGNNLRNQTATLEMPFWLFMAPLALGMALLSLETAVRLAHTWRRGHAEDKHTVLS
ncbi:MAG: TRAP transporter small permease [Betaproteobacteria bacterium]|nr:TRAP transporter small permease [Betaproteobacteria bacterium]MCC6250262.1 TRAP transporter small permease [Rubrivivax sp.]MCL4696413.1 TRAP transporter small permease [Burkholderiaceae bacterium]